MKIIIITVMVTVLTLTTVVRGQSGIPLGVVTRCYSTSDCSGPANKELCQLFDRSVSGDLNHCCFENATTLRSNPEGLSFTLNGGTCKRCNDTSVTNSVPVFCYDTCNLAGTPNSNSGSGMQTSNSGSGMQTSNSGSGIQTGKEDSSIGNNNECCSGGNNFEGFTTGASLTVECTPCHEIGTDATVGCDPHFFLPLANGDYLCFSVQGEPDFAFNLISDKYIKLNGQFVLPSEEESRKIHNVSTFLGDLALVIINRKMNSTSIIKVSALDHSVLVGNSLTIVKDKSVTVNVFKKVTTLIDAHVQANRLKDESAWLYINTDGFGVKIRFYKKHLDMFLTETDGLTRHTHGLIGQFLTADVKFDADNMLMQLGDRKPLSVKKDKAWPFLGINEECWYGANTDNQGTGIIEGIYIDYVVEDLIQK